jgi:quinone-modifying oxidoreductase subunit QmoC
MLWAQWGLKDRLMSDPDVWLCHQCNDCSVKCPRGARPGDVLGAVRQQSVRNYAVPHFISTWVNDARMLPVLLLVTAGLLGLALLARGPVENALGWTEHHGFYAEFFPHWLLNTFFPFFTMLSFFLLLVGLARFWGAMKAADAASGSGRPTVGIVPSVVRTVKSVLLHDRFGKCGAQAARRWTHLAAFYGFLALFVVTIWAVIDIYLMPALGIESLYPFDLIHPMKILANVGGVLLVYGGAKAILDRRKKGTEAGESTGFDWVFAWLLLGVGVTGFATEGFRFAVDPTAEGAGVTAAYATYFVHLVLVFQLLVYLPYSKFAHIFYRTVAMVYAEHTGRSNGAGKLPSGSKERIESEPAREAIAAGGE